MSENSYGVGNKAKDKAFGTALVGNATVDLIFGEHPHSRSDNNIYARFPSGTVEGFDGHRILTKVEIEESNYLKESELSGDEVRKGGSCRIFFDGIQCYEFFHRDSRVALLRAHHIIGQLKEHPSDWSIKSQREKLRGRKVFYRESPAIIESLIVDQGCLILVHDSNGPFPSPCYEKDRDRESTVKVEVDDPHIWWFRD